MTSNDLKAAIEALSLTEADSDDVRIVRDEDHGTLVVALHQTARHGVQMILVAQHNGTTARVRLAARHMRAIYETVGALLDQE